MFQLFQEQQTKFKLFMASSTEFINNVAETLINPAILLIFGIALLVFVWGVIGFIRGADNEEARTLGRDHIFWGLIGMAIMLSAFSLLRFVSTTLELDKSETPFNIDSIER